ARDCGEWQLPGLRRCDHARSRGTRSPDRGLRDRERHARPGAASTGRSLGPPRRAALPRGVRPERTPLTARAGTRMSARLQAADPVARVRSGCEGVVPLPSRLEPWQVELCARPDQLAGWIERYGSPLNVLDPAPLVRNAGELRAAATLAGVDLKVFFARKALALVDEARCAGLGIDVAGERELLQVLGRDVPAADVMVTAAVKPRALLELCTSSGATVVIDNADELRLLAEVAGHARRHVPVAFRLAPDLAAPTRFGLAPDEIMRLVDRFWQPGARTRLVITGLHFHLDGYEAAHRVAALGELLELADALAGHGHRISFADIGGGIPMSYLDGAEDWERFWSAHREALLGRGEPLTFEGHGLGLAAHAG